MSKKKKLIFRVGTGLAATSMALALGTGCPKDQPNVNTVAPAETNTAPTEEPSDPTPPTTNNAPGTNNAGTNGTTGMTTGKRSPNLDPPENVNTVPPRGTVPE